MNFLEISQSLPIEHLQTLSKLYIYEPTSTCKDNKFIQGCQIGFKTLRFLTLFCGRVQSLKYALIYLIPNHLIWKNIYQNLKKICWSRSFFFSFIIHWKISSFRFGTGKEDEIQQFNNIVQEVINDCRVLELPQLQLLEACQVCALIIKSAIYFLLYRK